MLKNQKFALPVSPTDVANNELAFSISFWWLDSDWLLAPNSKKGVAINKLAFWISCWWLDSDSLIAPNSDKVGNSL